MATTAPGTLEAISKVEPSRTIEMGAGGEIWEFGSSGVFDRRRNITKEPFLRR